MTYKINSFIDKTVKINSGTEVVNLKIGKYSYCGYDCKIIYAGIGKFCSIASNVVIGTPNHTINWLSTSPIFLKHKNTLNKNLGNGSFNQFEKVFLGNDVWIGERAIIKSGISIGDGAITGMGSIVTRDVAAYTVVGGNPAKIIKKRFSDTIIKKLLKIKWWDFSDELLATYSEYMQDVDKWLEINQ